MEKICVAIRLGRNSEPIKKPSKRQLIAKKAARDGVGLYYNPQCHAKECCPFLNQILRKHSFFIFFYDAHKLVLAKYEIFKS